ncbi:MAG: DegT/DnrJ/EryC1/StrS family aminotransferase [Bacillota bacterium]
MNIPMLNLPKQYHMLKDEIDTAIQEILASGNYIMGNAVSNFEKSIASFLGAKYAIGVASGSDALLLSLDALGIKAGDKVIVPTFTFFATAGAVSRLGATPIFVDIDSLTYNINLNQVESVLRKEENVKAIIPVHLFGLSADMNILMSLADKYGVKIVEDACQAINSEIDYKGNPAKVGTIGNTGCFSFFPSKNLGCFGDGGLIVTDDDELASRIKILRLHGSNPKYYHKIIGYNSRLDPIQAVVLDIKLKYLQEWTQKRFAVAKKYNEQFENLGIRQIIKCPEIIEGHAFHQYVIETEDRDKLVNYLQNRGVGTAVYYPIPLHLQECYKFLNYKPGDLPVAEGACQKVLALPIDPELQFDQVNYIVTTIKEYLEKGNSKSVAK